jgi:hypothetical protein
MTKTTTLLLFAAISLGPSAAVVVADDVPTFDVTRTCRAESEADPNATQSCIADERKAREVLVAQWDQFTSESKTGCMQEATGIVGVRSYVELLTCLQIAKDAKALPKNDASMRREQSTGSRAPLPW